MTVARHPLWHDRLMAFLAEHKDREYAWGRHDCLMFAAGAVKAVTGKDHAKGHRGKYGTQTGAYRYLSRLGHESPEALIDSLLEQKPVGFAQRGDIVMAADGIPALCMGAFAISVGRVGDYEGLVTVPRETWVKAWAVGDHHSGSFDDAERSDPQ